MKKVYINEYIHSYEPDCVDEYLHDMWAIGCDYDGCNTVESLKKLIDELVEMSMHARSCLWGGALFGIHGSPKKNEKGEYQWL